MYASKFGVGVNVQPQNRAWRTMSFERARDPAGKSARSLRYGLSVLGVVLIASVTGVSLASATPLGEAAGGAGSVVEPITATSPPSLPSAPPQVPVAVPAVPQTPVDQGPVKAPTPATPTPSPSSHLAPTPSGGVTEVSSPDADPPSIGATTGAAKEAGGVMGTPTEASQRAAAPVRNSAGGGSDSPNSGARATTLEVGVARSIEAAALPRWFAHVWPAIALGRAGEVLATLLARWEVATSLPISDATQLLVRLVGATESNIDAPTPSGRSAALNGSPAAPSIAPVPASGGMSLFLTMITSLLTLMALIALARLVVGEEFFSFLRWPSDRDHWSLVRVQRPLKRYVLQYMARRRRIRVLSISLLVGVLLAMAVGSDAHAARKKACGSIHATVGGIRLGGPVRARLVPCGKARAVVRFALTHVSGNAPLGPMGWRCARGGSPEVTRFAFVCHELDGVGRAWLMNGSRAELDQKNRVNS